MNKSYYIWDKKFIYNKKFRKWNLRNKILIFQKYLIVLKLKSPRYLDNYKESNFL